MVPRCGGAVGAAESAAPRRSRPISLTLFRMDEVTSVWEEVQLVLVDLEIVELTSARARAEFEVHGCRLVEYADGRPGAGLTVMQCTSSYPCPPQHVGLNVMRQMAERYGTPVGLSDHTLDGYSSYAAVTLGASVIEKHLTFSRAMYGSDARHALEPAGFARLVEGIRSIETMLASEVDKDDTAPYKEMKAVFQKSVAARTQIHAGTTITRAMLDVLKPGTGIPAKEIDRIVGRKAVRTIDAHTLLSEDDLD